MTPRIDDERIEAKVVDVLQTVHLLKNDKKGLRMRGPA